MSLKWNARKARTLAGPSAPVSLGVDALNHCVVGVFDVGESDFDGFLLAVGFHIFDDGLAVEGDDFYLILLDGLAGCGSGGG